MPKKGENEDRKKVPSSLYTREYFTTDCDGYDTFMESAGSIPERIREAMDMAGDLKDRWVLDLGCGRGELVREAALRGANVIGIDYADAAIELARELLREIDPGVRSKIELLKADAGCIPFSSGSFDVVFMVDVYEHLTPGEIEIVLEQIKRVLKPEGFLIIHTGPNTWFYKVGYPIVKTCYRLFLRRELPRDLRGAYDDIMHVNEQSPLSLHRGLQEAGYRARILPRSYLHGINPNAAERAIMKLLFSKPAGYFFCTSLLATAHPHERLGEQRIMAGHTVGMMKPASGYKVLAIGEREGILSNRLLRIGKIDTTWLEPSSPGNPATALNTTDGGFKSISGDCYNLPFEDSTFDSVCAQLTLDELGDPSRAVAEWARVLRNNGTMVLVTRNRLFTGMELRPEPRPRNRFSPRELAELARGAGLDVKEVSTLIPDLKIPRIYRGDLSFSFLFEKMPYFRNRGKLLFLTAVAESE
ncbi:MAG: methyltransferase domain-containing protein [Actinobacteria bacterium]|nr:methyltransferase domain-containing protein [Actinomycetota bacterium]